MKSDVHQPATDTPAASSRTPDKQGWRLLTGTAGIILTSTALVGVLLWRGADPILSARDRIDNIAGGSLLALLIALPVVIIVLWPVDLATRTAPRSVAAIAYTLVFALVGAVTGFVVNLAATSQWHGAWVGASIGFGAGAVGFLCAEFGTRPRWFAVALGLATGALIVYGTVQAQGY